MANIQGYNITILAIIQGVLSCTMLHFKGYILKRPEFFYIFARAALGTAYIGPQPLVAHSSPLVFRRYASGSVFLAIVLYNKRSAAQKK